MSKKDNLTVTSTCQTCILALGEDAFWRMKHTSLPRHIRARINVPCTPTFMYIYRKSTKKIVADCLCLEIRPLEGTDYFWEYIVTDYHRYARHKKIQELQDKDIEWIIDADNGLAVRREKLPDPLGTLSYLWEKPDGTIAYD